MLYSNTYIVDAKSYNRMHELFAKIARKIAKNKTKKL